MDILSPDQPFVDTGGTLHPDAALGILRARARAGEVGGHSVQARLAQALAGPSAASTSPEAPHTGPILADSFRDHLVTMLRAQAQTGTPHRPEVQDCADGYASSEYAHSTAAGSVLVHLANGTVQHLGPGPVGDARSPMRLLHELTPRGHTKRD